MMNFYVWQNPPPGDPKERASTVEWLPEDGAPRGPAPQCEACGTYLDKLKLIPPVGAELETWGKEYGDVAFGLGNEILVSERFLKAYETSGLVGLMDFSPAVIKRIIKRRRPAGSVPAYFFCRAVRGRATMDEVKSGFVRLKPWTCDVCRLAPYRRYFSIHFEPDTWGGEDVFIPRGLRAFVVVTERFKAFCEQHKFLNCHFFAAEDFGCDFYPWEK
jgi:hypothetical protein